MRSNKVTKIIENSIVTLSVISGGCVALISHEIYYGFVREWLAAPEGKIWISTGGKHSSYSIFGLFIISVVLGGFANVSIINISRMLGEYLEEGWGCNTMAVSFLLTLAVLFFLGLYGKPLFFRL